MLEMSAEQCDEQVATAPEHGERELISVYSRGQACKHECEDCPQAKEMAKKLLQSLGVQGEYDPP